MPHRGLLRSAASCSRCLRQVSTRAYSTSAPSPAHAPHLARLESRALLRIDGPDALHLLQGMTTADTYALKEAPGPLYSAILNAPGRVLLDVFLHKITGPNGKTSYLVEHDKTLTNQLVQHFRRHILRSKVKMTPVEDQSVFAAWSPMSLLELSNQQESQVGAVQDPRLESLGYRFVSSSSSQSSSSILREIQAKEATEDMYKLHRIRLGVPEGPDDLPPGVALPMESNIDYMGGIDLKKGCYVGQELTSRTHHTGVVRKRIVPVRFFQPAEGQSALDQAPIDLIPTAFDIPEPATQANLPLPAPQSDIRPSQSSVTKPRPSGKMGSSMWCTSKNASDQSVAIGLALVRLEQMSAESGNYGVFKVGDEGWLAKAFDVEWWARKAENIQVGMQR